MMMITLSIAINQVHKEFMEICSSRCAINYIAASASSAYELLIACACTFSYLFLWNKKSAHEPMVILIERSMCRKDVSFSLIE